MFAFLFVYCCFNILEAVEVQFMKTHYQVTEAVGVVTLCVNGSFTTRTVSSVNVTLSVAHGSASSAQCMYTYTYTQVY